MSKPSLRHLLPIAFLALSACSSAGKDECVPSPEVCDGKDNDCNGQVDDGLGVITCGLGVCEVTAPACVDGHPGECTPGTPQQEICDGLDNDCDGVIDNGCDCVQGTTQECYSGPAGTLGVGPCQGGVQTCTAGAWGPCVGEVKPAAETCNGVDDDCNGAVDDGLPPTTCGTGACAVTIASCESGAPTTCTPGSPSAEVCNGIDDDCNGEVDDGNPGGGIACTTAKPGVCAAGTTVCQGGAIVCNQTVQPSAEICDGLDNDCDGAVDNGNPGGGASCNTGKLGVCAAGTTTCQNGAIVCNQNVQPSAEICDGIDNDCDGVVDGGNPGGGTSCNTGKLGVCAAGTTTCQNGAIHCNQNVQPSAEVCDGLDNDCNGLVDDGGAKTTYYRDADGDGYGDPLSTVQACSQPAGYVANNTDCNDARSLVHPGAVEVCNGVDDNCNGVVDDGNPGGGVSCNTGKLGVCAAGTTACTGGVIVCNQNVQPSAEVCDGLDNDCNGLVDDGC